MVEKIVARRGEDFLMEFSVPTFERFYFVGGDRSGMYLCVPKTLSGFIE